MKFFRFDNEATRRCTAVLSLTILVGTIVDRTTGQPLTDVDVKAQGSATSSTRSDGTGKFVLRDLRAGHYTLTLSSDDVPPQTYDVVVGTAKSQRLSVKACSTTLDYSCAPR